MKVRTAIREARRTPRRAPRFQAFTLIELLIASTLLLFVALALVGSNVSGARISRLVQQQTDGQRLDRWVTTQLKQDVAAAHEVEVGAGSFGTFTAPTNGAAMVGNGMRLTYEGAGVTSRIYYVESTTLWSCDNAVWPPTAVLTGVINAQPFTAVDPVSVTNGLPGIQALTNQAGRALVRVRLQLSTLGGQSFFVGLGTAFQGNEIQFFATQRGN